MLKFPRELQIYPVLAIGHVCPENPQASASAQADS